MSATVLSCSSSQEYIPVNNSVSNNAKNKRMMSWVPMWKSWYEWGMFKLHSLCTKKGREGEKGDFHSVGFLPRWWLLYLHSASWGMIPVPVVPGWNEGWLAWWFPYLFAPTSQEVVTVASRDAETSYAAVLCLLCSVLPYSSQTSGFPWSSIGQIVKCPFGWVEAGGWMANSSLWLHQKGERKSSKFSCPLLTYCLLLLTTRSLLLFWDFFLF